MYKELYRGAMEAVSKYEVAYDRIYKAYKFYKEEVQIKTAQLDEANKTIRVYGKALTAKNLMIDTLASKVIDRDLKILDLENQVKCLKYRLGE